MKNKLLVVLMGVIIVALAACSNTDDKSEINKTPKEDTVVETEDTESKKDTEETVTVEDEPTALETKDKKEEKQVINKDKASAENVDVKNTTKTVDVLNYIRLTYPLDKMIYTTDTWKNEQTGRTEYIITIKTDDKELDQEITKSFKEDKVYENDNSSLMMETAEAILTDIPEVNTSAHVESVNWVSTSEENLAVTLIQDRAQSTIN